MIHDLVAAMGVPVREGSTEGIGTLIGDPPGGHAESVIVDGAPCVAQLRDDPGPSLVEDLLHEACHLVIGPRSLDEEIETGLIVYQWALAQELDPLERRWIRQALSQYGFWWTDEAGGQRIEIGLDDEVFASKEWLDGEDLATGLGLLDRDGKAKLGLGVHADWRTWIDEQKEAS